MKKINLKIAFKDRRGKIIDLVEGEKINAITSITIKKGAIRGPVAPMKIELNPLIPPTKINDL